MAGGVYPCSVCGKPVTTVPRLQAHLATHGDTSSGSANALPPLPHPCHLYGIRFASIQELVTHLALHQGGPLTVSDARTTERARTASPASPAPYPKRPGAHITTPRPPSRRPQKCPFCVKVLSKPANLERKTKGNLLSSFSSFEIIVS